MPDNVIPMGVVVGAFGILGWIKIKTSTQEYDSLGKYPSLLLMIDGNWVKYKVENFSTKSNVFSVKLENILNRDHALSLKGVLVGVLRSEFPHLPSDEYYWTDLIGMNVYNLAQESFGNVINLMETGANSVLVVKNANGIQRLIPFVGKHIVNVDITNGQIIVDWGLDY